MPPLEKHCRNCQKIFLQFSSLNPYCSSKCKQANGKNYKIKPVSEKRKAQNFVYSELRRLFLLKPENQICPITGEPTTDVHHMRGRVGTLFLDTRYWLAVSREGHRKIEESPAWAYEMGYSLKRI